MGSGKIEKNDGNINLWGDGKAKSPSFRPGFLFRQLGRVAVYGASSVPRFVD
jgi:hypothetical protein